MEMKKNKIPVGILGATGSVGQRFVQLLQNHPWFEIASVAASGRSANKLYKDAVNWILPTPMPEQTAHLTVQACEPNLPCKLVFSGLDAAVAGTIEEKFANAGYVVLSNARNHRFDPSVPLLVPEVNPDHLEMITCQSHDGGAIITNPNCSTVGLVMALKPLLHHFGLEAAHVVTMQALSGAGYPGVASLQIQDNVLPFIAGEEAKMETEPLKILGHLQNGEIKHLNLNISAQCNRVAVSDGHLECVSVKLQNRASTEDMIDAWRSFSSEPQKLALPSAPAHPIYYFDEPEYPQPKIHRDLDKGMAVSIGRLSPCKVLDYKFVLLVHNTIRGAAGGAILNAELLVKKGLAKDREK